MKFRDTRRNSANRVALHLARGEEPIEHSVFGQPAHLDRVLDGFGMLHANLGSEHEGVRTLKNREHAEVHTRRKTRVQTHLLGAVVEPMRELGTIQECKMNRLLDLENRISGDKDVRYVRLLEIRFSRSRSRFILHS